MPVQFQSIVNLKLPYLNIFHALRFIYRQTDSRYETTQRAFHFEA